MGRKTNEERLNQIGQFIRENSGEYKAGTIGSMLGIDNKTMMRALSQLEERGDLLDEDPDEKVGWFGRRKS